MKHQRHFGTSAAREAVQTRALIADLDRIVQILNNAIAAEEQLVLLDHKFRRLFRGRGRMQHWHR